MTSTPTFLSSVVKNDVSMTGAGSDRGSRDVVIIFTVLGLFLAAVVAGVLVWGVVALAMAALAVVPLILGLLVVITFG